jgi:hypothetical protein
MVVYTNIYHKYKKNIRQKKEAGASSAIFFQKLCVKLPGIFFAALNMRAKEIFISLRRNLLGVI